MLRQYYTLASNVFLLHQNYLISFNNLKYKEMKTTVSLSDFRSAFNSMDRKENFSYEGLEVIFDYLEQLEEETGEETELDVISICCDFTEYEDMDEFRANYGDDYETIEDVENSTIVLKVDDERFIIQNF